MPTERALAQPEPVGFDLGRGPLGVTVIVSLVTFFPTLVNVAVALRAAPTLACDVVLSMGGSW